MELQQKQIDDREKDRELLQDIIQMQSTESREMTAMFGELVGILKNKSSTPSQLRTPPHSAAYSFHPQSLSLTQPEPQSQDLTYAGVGGGCTEYV